MGGYFALCCNQGQIPSSIERLGRSFYVHFDFNCPASYLSAPELLEFSQKLPEYLEFFKAKLRDLKSGAELARGVVEKLEVE